MKIPLCTIIVLFVVFECTSGQGWDADLNDFFGLRPPRTTTKRINLKPVTPSGDKDGTTKTYDDFVVTTPETTSTSTTTERTAVSEGDLLCGRRKIEHVGLVTSGSSTLPGDWPWHVAIYRVKAKGLTQSYICGGTLISYNRVVTAGHCVVDNGAKITPERLTLYFGRHDLVGGDVGSQQRHVFDINLHPRYNFTTLANDVAILILSTMVTYTEYVQPICLWDDDSDKSKLVDEVGVIVGWGYTEKDVLSTTLMMASIPVVDDWDCLARDPAFYSIFLTRNTFCAGDANGTSPCNGDSGGGMYFSKKVNGKKYWYLRGVISLSSKRVDSVLCDSKQYAIFTDLQRYKKFIDVRR